MLTVYPAVSWAPRVGAHEYESMFRKLSDFYPRDAMLARVFATATCLSVFPSVWTSVCHTPVLCLAERTQDRDMYTDD